jgi:peptidoglycan/LPS O-acetylase OafA/YrhL
MKPQRYPNFDLLRLFLALEVVLMHCLHYGHHPFFLPIPPVATFVCLSGFLIPASYARSRSIRHFAWKRALRIMPVFLISLLLVVGLFGRSAALPTLAFYASTGLLGSPGFNAPLWSLALEEACYAFHVLSRLLCRWNWGIAWTSLLTATCAWIAWRSSGPINLATQPDHHMSAVTAFLAGNVLFHETKRWQAWRASYVAAALVISIICLSVTTLASIVPLVTLSVCTLTIIFLQRMPQIRCPIPDISYSIYAYHFPVVIAVGATSLVDVPKVVLYTILLSLPSWYLVESQALRLKNWQPLRGGRYNSSLDSHCVSSDSVAIEPS